MAVQKSMLCATLQKSGEESHQDSHLSEWPFIFMQKEVDGSTSPSP